jgi:hypothetical protein
MSVDGSEFFFRSVVFHLFVMIYEYDDKCQRSVFV